MLRRLGTTLGILVLVASAAMAQPVPASPGAYRMDRERTSVSWKVDQLGYSKFTGRFTRFDGTLNLDPDSLEDAKLVVIIDPASIRTDFPFAEHFDKELSDDTEFLNSPRFPRITFASTKVERTGRTMARVTGELTMLGITRPLALDVALESAGGQPAEASLVFTATGKLRRSDFGIVTRTFIIDDVSLQIEAAFKKF